jgi:hypothetical protein
MDAEIDDPWSDKAGMRYWVSRIPKLIDGVVEAWNKLGKRGDE